MDAGGLKMLLKIILMSIFWIQFVFLVILTKESKEIKAEIKELARNKEFLDTLEEL